MLRQTKSVTTILGDDSSGICASKAVVLDKLNGLSSQVVAELENLNATDAAKLQSSIEANKVPFHPSHCVKNRNRPLRLCTVTSAARTPPPPHPTPPSSSPASAIAGVARHGDWHTGAPV